MPKNAKKPRGVLVADACAFRSAEFIPLASDEDHKVRHHPNASSVDSLLFENLAYAVTPPLPNFTPA